MPPVDAAPLAAPTRVLVTGGTGFVGAHTVAQALALGHEVRTTVRSAAKEAGVRTMLTQARVDQGRLSFHVADLTADEGWDAAVEGCDYVLHVAAPIPSRRPKSENELIAPARDGSLRVLRAAERADVKRVVMTSSFGAVGYGHGDRTAVYTEADWSNLDGPTTPYVRAKTLGERAAWEWAKTSRTELAVVNPGGITGPVLGAEVIGDGDPVKQMLQGKVPVVPKYSIGLVDVRDVADLHLRAMTDPAAAGERFLAISGRSVSLLELAELLRRLVPELATKTPTRTVPNWMVRALARVEPSMAEVVLSLGKSTEASSEKAQTLLGWSPRTIEVSVLETARSLQANGLLKR